MWYFVITHGICCSFPSVWVHGWHEVNPCAVDQLPDVLVAGQVLGAQVVRQVEQQLTTQNLIPMHVGYVFHLRLTCSNQQRLQISYFSYSFYVSPPNYQFHVFLDGR